jgi:hypothetical protein
MTINHDEVTVAARRRTALIAGLLDLAAYCTAHPSAPLVTGTLNIPVPDGARGVQVAALEEIAREFGTEMTERPDGTLIAESRFEGVRVEAHLCHPDRSVSGYKARAAQAGNGAAA